MVFNNYNTPFITRLGHTTSVLAKDANFRSPQGIEFGCNQFGLVLSIGTCWFLSYKFLLFSPQKKVILFFKGGDDRFQS